MSAIPTASPKATIFVKHRKLIRKLCDIFLICILLFNLLLFMHIAIPILIKNIFNPPSEPEIRAGHVEATWFILLTATISLSGLSGVLIGLLSVFQSNLTKVKRGFLLIIIVLPLASFISALLIDPHEDPWSILKLGLLSLLGCLLVNGPAVLIGKTFFQIINIFVTKLYRASRGTGRLHQ
ncbi:MAG: hypothetical protein ACYS6W_02425 [Planctomycetota bacterium]|jgi:hypothetical protein